MTFYPIFLSVVIPIRNQSDLTLKILSDLTKIIAPLVSDYEIIVIDNASTDDSVSILKEATSINGLPNLQIFALTKEVDSDTVSWVGFENALGDFTVVIDPFADDVNFISQMLEKSVAGADVVFATNKQKPLQTISYNAAFFIFRKIYTWFNGIDLAEDAPQFRILSKRVINFIQQHPHPSLTYRHLPATAGFTRVNLQYSAPPKLVEAKKLSDSVDRGLRMLVSTTRGPMRLVTTLSIFGAISNLFYSVYVVIVGIFKTDVAPGWISLSLQQSGMFFLISLVLLVLGEYILNMAALSNEGPAYHVAQEFTSARMTRLEKLNIEDTSKSATSTVRR